MFVLRALLLALLALVPAVVPALAVQCPEQCICGGGEELQFSCTVDNSTVEILAQLNRYVNIDCQGGVLSCSLPSLPLGRNTSLPSLSINSCVLEDIGCVLQALAVTEVATVTLMQARSTIDTLHWAGLGISSLSVYTAVAQDVPTAVLSTLPLRSFRLNGGHVTLSPDTFKNARPLKYLELSSDKITHIPPGTFRGLDSLEQLNLFGNNITEVGDDALLGLPALQQLSLSTSRVQVLGAGALARTPRLQTFVMLRARMTQLGDIFKDLHELETVSISNDLPLSLPVLTSPSLRVLSLNYCTLSSPPALHTPQLQNLSLSHNQLKKLPKLDRLFQLIELKVDYNLLETLSDDMFSGLRLVHLSMSHNKLHTISNNAFRGASSIQFLSLSHNSLTLEEGLGQGEYANLDSQSPINLLQDLITLDLSYNEIRRIFHDWGQVLLHLKVLDLSWNNLDMINSSEIQFLSARTVVDLSHNNISTIELDTYSIAEGSDVRPTNDRGVMLLANNPLSCDCRMYGFVRRLHGAVSLTPELTPDATDAKCAAPSDLRETLLTDLDPMDLTCDLPECPATCTCLYRAAAMATDLDCSSLHNLQVLRHLGINNMWLKLHKPPASFSEIPDFVTKLNLSDLKLTDVPAGRPPDNLKMVDLRGNMLQDIPFELLDYNVTTYLAGNPIECCDVNDLKGVADANDMRCNVCENRAAIIAAGSVLVLAVAAVLLGTVITVRWRREAKVWLAAKGWFARQEELGTEPYDAFVSFAHGDEEWVRYKLIPALEQEWRICVHYRDWAVGELIPTQIARSVSDARRTLAVVSKHFIQSQWAKLEFRAAAQRALAERRPRLLVLLLDDSLGSDTSIDPELKAYLATSTYLSGSDPNFWAKLRKAMPPPRQDPSPLPLPSGPLNVALTPNGKLININDKLQK